MNRSMRRQRIPAEMGTLSRAVRLPSASARAGEMSTVVRFAPRPFRFPSETTLFVAVSGGTPVGRGADGSRWVRQDGSWVREQSEWLKKRAKKKAD